MSREIAEIDGIKMEYITAENGYKYLYYHVNCCHCGADILRKSYGRKQKYSCEECKLKLSKIKPTSIKLDPIGEIQTSNKPEMRVLKAVKAIEKQGYSIHSREKAISLAMTRKEKYGSVPEAMMAIELIHKGYRIIPQQQIGSYKVDFCLPDQKAILEIDGGIFHADMSKEAERDFKVMCIMGKEWRIIRVPAEVITDKLGLAIAYLQKRLSEGHRGQQKGV